MAGYATPAWTNDASPAIDDSALLDIGHGIEIAEHPYGVCSTAAATAAKTVTIDYSGTLTLFTGLTVRVKFTNGNSAASPTLNVNSTGDKAIVYGTSFAAGGGWTAGAVTELTYDGTNWVMCRAEAADTTPTSGSTNLITSGAVFSGLQRRVNPNLLHNWYFAGGGTAGKFPINQRLVTTYSGSGAGITIDRWRRANSISMTLNSDYITLTDTNWGIYQEIEWLPAGTYTWSVLARKATVKAGTNGGMQAGFDSTYRPSVLTAVSGNDWALVWGTATFATSGQQRFRLQFNANNSSSYSIEILAVKAELGTEQTLCHNEGTDANPIWVLNEIPDYQQELAKCQRFFLNLNPYKSAYAPFGYAVARSTTNFSVFYTLPVQMRALPTLTFSGLIEYAKNYLQVTSLSVVRGSGLVLNIDGAVSSGLTNGDVSQLRASADGGGQIFLSAEI